MTELFKSELVLTLAEMGQICWANRQACSND